MAGVPAGRLSIEIVAEIARLSKDLESAKRQVAAASADIGRSAKGANDNIAGMGTAMGGVNRMSRSMAANFLNLSRQGQDVATMFAMGAPPMQVFTSQAAQIVDVLGQMKREAAETGTSLTAMSMRGLGKIGPYALAAAAAVGVLAAAMESVTDEINETSAVTVTWQDTALGAFDMVAAYVSGVVTDAFNALGLDVGKVWQGIVDGVASTGNMIIGTFVASQRLVLAAWQTFPGAFAEMVINGVNGAIRALEGLVNGASALLNSFSQRVNGIIGTDLGMIGMLDIPEIENSFAGAGARAGTAMAGAVGSSFRDYFGDVANAISPFAQARANARMQADAAEAGGAAGQRAGAAAARALAEETAQALADLDAAAKQAVIDALAAQNKTKTYADNLREKTEAERAAMQELADQERALGEERINELADLYEDLFSNGIGSVWDTFKRQGLQAIAQVAAQWTLSLISGQSGGATRPGGNPLADIFGSVFGGGASVGAKGAGGAGSATRAGGALTQLFGGSGAGAGALASAAGPVGLYVAGVTIANGIGEGLEKLTGIKYSKTGGMIGGLLGGFIGGLLQGSEKGSGSIRGGKISVTGDNKEFEAQAGTLADTVLQSIESIASALGVSANMMAGAVSIGVRDGKYRVDPSGMGATKSGNGVLDFGTNAEAAVTAAIADLLKDGVIGGISQASQNILRAGGDLQKAIEKAVLIESIPKLLRERTDPLGAALDALDTRFKVLADALREGGATAQQYADAEKLYNLERKDVIEQMGSGVKALRDYMKSLEVGSNSPLSLRSQYATASADLAKYETAIRGGQTVDQEAFTQAAQALLGVSRQTNASGEAFFADFERIRELTQQAIGNVENGTNAPGDGSVVFLQQTASNTQSLAVMQEETNGLLRDIRTSLTGNTASEGGRQNTGWIAAKRQFAA